MLTCDDLPLFQDAVQGFAGTSLREKTECETRVNSRSRYCCKFWGVIWSGKMCVVPEFVFHKMQTYLTSKNVKELQAFVGI